MMTVAALAVMAGITTAHPAPQQMLEKRHSVTPLSLR